MFSWYSLVIKTYEIIDKWSSASTGIHRSPWTRGKVRFPFYKNLKLPPESNLSFLSVLSIGTVRLFMSSLMTEKFGLSISDALWFTVARRGLSFYKEKSRPCTVFVRSAPLLVRFFILVFIFSTMTLKRHICKNIFRRIFSTSKTFPKFILSIYYKLLTVITTSSEPTIISFFSISQFSFAYSGIT